MPKQEMEYEFKAMTDADEYRALHRAFAAEGLAQESILQVNHYFDTDDFLLAKGKGSLRVRVKDGALRLEFKQHLCKKDGQHINREHSASLEALPEELFLSSLVSPLPEGFADGPYRYLGKLTTLRHNYRKDGMLISLDKSEYLDHCDYEIEIETQENQDVRGFLREMGVAFDEGAVGKYPRFAKRYQEMHNL